MADPNPASVLADTEAHHLHSHAVGDDFKLFIGRCGPEGAEPAAVLYLTDANGAFGSAVDQIRAMQLMAHLPPILVVGIGYPVGSLGETVDIRMRDLTPSVDQLYVDLVPDAPPAGGGPAFHRFVVDELMPWVDDRYGTAAGRRVYYGHSLGGLFGCWTLFTAPGTFTDYLIGSPSLWWDSGMVFALERAYAASNDDLAARVFFGIGAHETHEGRQREAVNMSTEQRAIAAAAELDMVADMARLVDALRSRAYPGLALRSSVFADEFHVTVSSLNLSRGLRWALDAPT